MNVRPGASLARLGSDDFVDCRSGCEGQPEQTSSAVIVVMDMDMIYRLFDMRETSPKHRLLMF